MYVRRVMLCLALFAAYGQWQSDRWVLPLIEASAADTALHETGAWTPRQEIQFRTVFGTFTFLTPQAISMAILLAAVRIVAPQRAVAMAPFLNAVCLVTAVMFCLLRVLGYSHFDKANAWRAQWDFMETNGYPSYGYWCWAFHSPLLLCPVLDTWAHQARVTRTTYAMLMLYLVVFHCMVATTLFVTGALPYPWYVDMYLQGAKWGTLTFLIYIGFVLLLFDWVLRALSSTAAPPIAPPVAVRRSLRTRTSTKRSE